MNDLYYLTRTELAALKENLHNKTVLLTPAKNTKDELQWQKAAAGGLFDYCGNTSFSPKNFLLPQAEELFSYKRHNGKINIDPPSQPIKPITFWGIRPCDLKAIELLDKVFLGEGFVDVNYNERRKKSFFIGLHCMESSASCFCTSLPYDLTTNDVYDLLLFELNENEYLVKIGNSGDKLLSEAKILKRPATNNQLKILEEALAKFNSGFKINFKLSNNPNKLQDFFDDDSYFETVGFKCLECGICSYVCPTCYCFTVEDVKHNQSGCRTRCWDYCTHCDFTAMAGGHNPRSSKTARIRQRFLHKGYYFKELYNELGCVGCGRCLAKCPVSMDICEGLQHVYKGEDKE